MRKMNSTLKKLIIGIIIFMVLFGIIGILIVDNKVSYILGLILGTVLAILLSISMYITIDKALDLDPESAVKYSRKMSILRMVVMGMVVLIALKFPHVFNAIAVLLGILTLKLSAFVQPITNKYISTKNIKQRKVRM